MSGRIGPLPFEVLLLGKIRDDCAEQRLLTELLSGARDPSKVVRLLVSFVDNNGSGNHNLVARGVAASALYYSLNYPSMEMEFLVGLRGWISSHLQNGCPDFWRCILEGFTLGFFRAATELLRVDLTVTSLERPFVKELSTSVRVLIGVRHSPEYFRGSLANAVGDFARVPADVKYEKYQALIRARLLRDLLVQVRHDLRGGAELTPFGETILRQVNHALLGLMKAEAMFALLSSIESDDDLGKMLK